MVPWARTEEVELSTSTDEVIFLLQEFEQANMSKDPVDIEVASEDTPREIEEPQTSKLGAINYLKDRWRSTVGTERERRYIRKVDAYLL